MPTAITDDPGPFSKLDWQSPPQRTRTVDTGIVDQGYLDLAYPGSTLGLFNSGHPIAVWIGDRSARAGDVLLRYFTRSRR